jgi:glycerol uptake facilitator-like aquaporin
VTELADQPETGTGSMHVGLARRLVAEAVGSALLVIAVVGSGIMAQRLSPDDTGVQLLENSIATAGALVGLILTFGAVSGAHFNPVVTIVDRLFGTLTTSDAATYVTAQVVGACVGFIHPHTPGTAGAPEAPGAPGAVRP